jgi:hypothetical protein
MSQGEGTGYRIKCGCVTSDYCARWGCLEKEKQKEKEVSKSNKNPA